MNVTKKAISTTRATQERAENSNTKPLSVGTIPDTKYLIKKTLAISSAIFIINKIFVEVFMLIV